MAKKLALTQIKQDNKKYSIVERIYLDDDKEVYLDIHPNFKIEEINNVLSDFTRLNSIAVKNKIMLPDNIFYLFLTAVAVDHFSNLNLPKKDPVKYIQGLLELINHSSFPKIVDSFPKENWTDLMTRYFEYSKTLVQLVDTADKLKISNKENNTEDKSKVSQIVEEAKEKVKEEKDADV